MNLQMTLLSSARERHYNLMDWVHLKNIIQNLVLFLLKRQCWKIIIQRIFLACIVSGTALAFKTIAQPLPFFLKKHFP